MKHEVEVIAVTAKDVSTMLSISVNSVYKLRDDGILPEIENLCGCRYRVRDVLALVGMDKDEYSPYRYQCLQLENKKLREEISQLKTTIRKVCLLTNFSLMEEKE